MADRNPTRVVTSLHGLGQQESEVIGLVGGAGGNVSLRILGPNTKDERIVSFAIRVVSRVQLTPLTY